MCSAAAFGGGSKFPNTWKVPQQRRSGELGCVAALMRLSCYLRLLADTVQSPVEECIVLNGRRCTAGGSSHVGKVAAASCLLEFPDIELWSCSTIAVLD